MITAVFDCMVFLQAATNDQSPAYACLELVELHEVQLHLTPSILTEIQDVLSRPRIRAKFPRLTPERVNLFLQKVAAMAVIVDNIPDVGLLLRDPDDLPYLNLAVAAGVGYIISHDNDLLSLMTDPRFISRWPKLQVVDPVAFLQIARSPRTP
jgi:putative PIN family toxin of toxin-antitoxin system